MFNFLKKSDNYYHFMKFHKICFAISIIAIVMSILSFFIRGLNFGVDFTGGLLFDITVKDNNDIATLRAEESKAISKEEKERRLEEIRLQILNEYENLTKEQLEKLLKQSDSLQKFLGSVQGAF